MQMYYTKEDIMKIDKIGSLYMLPYAVLAVELFLTASVLNFT